jgi:hypothetical protein
MQEALIGFVFLVVASLIGMCIPANQDQKKPLVPQASGGDSGHDHHH